MFNLTLEMDTSAFQFSQEDARLKRFSSTSFLYRLFFLLSMKSEIAIFINYFTSECLRDVYLMSYGFVEGSELNFKLKSMFESIKVVLIDVFNLLCLSWVM